METNDTKDSQKKITDLILNFFQIYEIIDPTHGLMRHYIECHDVGRLHVPAVLLIAGNL